MNAAADCLTKNVCFLSSISITIGKRSSPRPSDFSSSAMLNSSDDVTHQTCLGSRLPVDLVTSYTDGTRW